LMGTEYSTALRRRCARRMKLPGKRKEKKPREVTICSESRGRFHKSPLRHRGGPLVIPISGALGRFCGFFCVGDRTMSKQFFVGRGGTDLMAKDALGELTLLIAMYISCLFFFFIGEGEKTPRRASASCLGSLFVELRSAKAPIEGVGHFFYTGLARWRLMHYARSI